jgi:chromosome segregation ATPase
MAANARTLEPVFDPAGRPWPTLLESDILALEHTIARQSAELNLRLTEVIDLYNFQQQQENELQAAREEIDRLNRIVSELQQAVSQSKAEVAAAQNKIGLLENEKTVLREELERVVHDSRRTAGQLLAMETAFKIREGNVASALEQVELMSTELTAASAERFKLVAAVQAERKQHRNVLNERSSILEDRIRKAEAVAENRERRIKNLEEDHSRLTDRAELLEALLKSERETSELKIKRLTDDPPGSPAFVPMGSGIY